MPIARIRKFATNWHAYVIELLCRLYPKWLLSLSKTLGKGVCTPRRYSPWREWREPFAPITARRCARRGRRISSGGIASGRLTSIARLAIVATENGTGNSTVRNATRPVTIYWRESTIIAVAAPTLGIMTIVTRNEGCVRERARRVRECGLLPRRRAQVVPDPTLRFIPD